MSKGSPQFKRNKRVVETAHYLSVINAVLTCDEIAEFTVTTESTVRNWQTKRTGPNSPATKRLGELAACVRFLDNKLGFTDEESRIYLATKYIDPETYEPTSVLQKLHEGNVPLVIQKAIEWSVNGSFPE